MTKRVLGGFLVGMMLLAGPGLAQGAVELPPAEAEVAALEDAFAQLTGFFRCLIIEIRGSLTMLGKRVEDLERSSLVFRTGLEGLAERILGHERQLTGLAGRLTTVERAIEGTIGPKVAELDGRILGHEGQLTGLAGRLTTVERAIEGTIGPKVAELDGRILGHESQLTGLAGRLTTVERAIEGTIGPKVVELDGRIGALEKHDFASLERRLAALDRAREALSVRIDHNRAKIEALEVALVAVNAATEERLAVAVAEVQDEAAAQRQEIETVKSELTRLAQAQQAQWTAIFLVPIVVGGLLYLLLAQSG